MVWGDPDAASPEMLDSHVTRLRRVLTPAGLAIVGDRPDYRLPVAAERVDLARFDELLHTDPDGAGRGGGSRWACGGDRWVDNLTLAGVHRPPRAVRRVRQRDHADQDRKETVPDQPFSPDGRLVESMSCRWLRMAAVVTPDSSVWSVPMPVSRSRAACQWRRAWSGSPRAWWV
jgi:hypothetical protein